MEGTGANCQLYIVLKETSSDYKMTRITVYSHFFVFLTLSQVNTSRYIDYTNLLSKCKDKDHICCRIITILNPSCSINVIL